MPPKEIPEKVIDSDNMLNKTLLALLTFLQNNTTQRGTPSIVVPEPLPKLPVCGSLTSSKLPTKEEVKTWLVAVDQAFVVFDQRYSSLESEERRALKVRHFALNECFNVDILHILRERIITSKNIARALSREPLLTPGDISFSMMYEYIKEEWVVADAVYVPIKMEDILKEFCKYHGHLKLERGTPPIDQTRLYLWKLAQYLQNPLRVTSPEAVWPWFDNHSYESKEYLKNFPGLLEGSVLRYLYTPAHAKLDYKDPKLVDSFHKAFLNIIEMNKEMLHASDPTLTLGLVSSFENHGISSTNDDSNNKVPRITTIEKTQEIDRILSAATQLLEANIDSSQRLESAARQLEKLPIEYETRREINSYQKKSVTCYNCNKTGHYANECNVSESRPITNVTCYNCGKTGHYAGNCKHARLRSRSRDRSYDNKSRNGYSKDKNHTRPRSYPRSNSNHKDKNERYRHRSNNHRERSHHQSYNNRNRSHSRHRNNSTNDDRKYSQEKRSRSYNSHYNTHDKERDYKIAGENPRHKEKFSSSNRKRSRSHDKNDE